MAIKKQFVKSKPVCKVTFTVEAKEANNVSVIGDFNNWSAEGGALKKQKDGVFKGTFELAKDQNYEFRYFIDDTFVNEQEADSFKFNEFAGVENAVLSV
jgi:1,4-alpha-glucan branching enzyme